MNRSATMHHRTNDLLYAVMMCGGILIGYLSPMPLWLTLAGALTGYWSTTWLGNQLFDRQH